MNIPPLPIDFGSIAAKGVEVLGSIAAAVAGVVLLGALLLMGFQWIRHAFTDSGDLESRANIDSGDDSKKIFVMGKRDDKFEIVFYDGSKMQFDNGEDAERYYRRHTKGV